MSWTITGPQKIAGQDYWRADSGTTTRFATTKEGIERAIAAPNIPNPALEKLRRLKVIQ